jgi:hypothetical protein
MKPESDKSDNISVSVNKPAASVPKQPPQKGKVFDVMRPGKAMSNPTSRPVISSHNPAVQNTLSGMTGIGDAKPLLDPKRRSIAPMETTDEPGSAPDVPAPEQATEVVAAALVAKEPATPAPEPAKADPSPVTAPDVADQLLGAADTPTEPAAPASVPEVAEPSKASEPAARTAPETPASHRSTLAEEIDPLEDATAPDGDASPVVVSHHSSSASFVKIALIIVVIVVLAIVAFDVMLDSGIVSVDGIPHTRLLPQ